MSDQTKPNQVTVVYDVVDERAWRDGGNPLHYEHHGLRAHTVAAYDAVQQCEDWRIMLDGIEMLLTPAGRE